jgi:nucleotide-binding universal stress UspA family protein
MKILVAVDGSPFTQQVLAYLASHDEWLGKQHQYTMLTVVAALPPHAASAVGREACKSYYEDQATEVFEPLRKFVAEKGLDATFESKVGPAAATISETAEKGGFDLLVMGSHGHGSLATFVLGSVTSKVLNLGKTPVLIVR